jgi:hypothetical protein
LNCVHCGAELSDREEICTLCGQPTKEPEVPAAPAEPAVPAYGSPTTSIPHTYGGVGFVGDPEPANPFANNSGMGPKSSLPTELEGVNWGGFFLTWIWGIGNRVWLSFLVFVPGGNYVMPWVLLIKGNEWAWKSRRWDSVQQFQEVQRTWAIAGLVITVLVILLACAAWFLLASAGVVSNTPPPGTQIT